MPDAPSSSHSLSARATAALQASLRRTDDGVAHFNRLLTSSANVDTTLLTVGYTFALVHAVLARLERAQLHLAAARLIARVTATAPTALLPGEALVATLTTSPDSRLVRGKQAAKALATLISGHRMFLRLLGLPRIWSWAAATARRPPADPLLRGVTVVQIAACALFQWLENTAYLAANGVLAMPPERIARRFVWSARFWAVHVFLQFVSLARRRQLAAAEPQPEAEKKEVVQAERVRQEATWWRDLYVNAAWAPLTIHWSIPGGYMPDEGIALLSLTAGWLGLRQAWIASA